MVIMGSTQQLCRTSLKDTTAKLIVCAIQEGNVEKLQELLPKEIVDQVVKDDWTPLLFACMSGVPKIVCYLLDNGSNANQDCALFTPLMAVCSSGNHIEGELVKCAQALVTSGADVDAMDQYKTTPLMLACRNGKKELVSFLLDSKCDINKYDNDGMTALHLAVTFNQPEIVRMLLDHGAIKNMKDRRGVIPLDAAITKGLENIIQMLQDEEFEPVAAPQIYIRKKTSFEEMLAELPSYHNASGKDGFYKEVGLLLGGMGLDKFVSLFNEKNVSLCRLLNSTNKELKEVGVKFSTHRQKILKDNLRFIQHKWASSSLPVVNNNTPVDLVDIARSMANTAKHLHILWASSLFCTERISFDSESQTAVEDIYQVTLRTVKQVETLMKELRRIHHHASMIEKTEKLSPVDLILPEKNCKYLTVHKLAMVAVVLGMLNWKFNFLTAARKLLTKVNFLKVLRF